MKRSCKNIFITNWKTLMPWVYDCIMRHKKRHDFRKLLMQHGLEKEQYLRGIQEQNYSTWESAIENIAKDASERIKARDLKLPAVQIRIKEDRTTGKIRLIGKESAMQQVMDHIAVGAAMSIFRRRIVPQQCSSIPGRGQVYGMRMLRAYVMADNRANRYAHSHGLRYAQKCKYLVKLDVKKCYPNADYRIFMKHFKRDCGNPDLLWLWEQLLRSHQVDGYSGFMIGALVSQWAAQYLLSFAYRHIVGLASYRRGKRVRWVTHAVLFMDDISLYSSSRNNLRKAVESLIRYAATELGFTIKLNYSIHRNSEYGCDMMGFVVHQNGKVEMRGRNYIKSRRLALRCHRNNGLSARQAKRLLSFKGFYKHSDCRKAADILSINQVFKYAQNLVSRTERKFHENILLRKAGGYLVYAPA